MDTPSPFVCDDATLSELATGLSCPCCDKPLSPAHLARFLTQVRDYEARRGRGILPARREPALPTRMYIDPHAHMISRTTDDYEAMAAAGVVALIEPSFWLGQPRTNIGSFVDYFATILGFERFRAGQFGIRHYCTIGLNPKEANNERLAAEVLERLPLFLGKEGVVAMGELGYDEQTPAEDRAFRAQIELAKEFDLPVLVHTPHRDKRAGALRSMAVLAEHGFAPERCVIDHNNEETVADILDRGYWCAFSVYPHTKMASDRMAGIVQRYGSDRLIVNSACDWGVSDPLSVPKTAALMAERGLPESDIGKVTYDNALAVYGLNGEMAPAHWLEPAPIDQRTVFQGNSILRGGQAARIEQPTPAARTA